MKNQTLGNMISTLRKEQGMTQADLAEKMNVTDKAVSKWERDLSCPDVNSLPRLAEEFGVSVDELMQVKNRAGNGDEKEKIGDIVSTVLKALAVGMGVAVVVLTAMKAVDTNSALSMLGIGLACAGVSLFQGKKD